MSLVQTQSLVQRTLAIRAIHNFRNTMLTCADKIKNYLNMTTSLMTVKDYLFDLHGVKLVTVLKSLIVC